MDKSINMIKFGVVLHGKIDHIALPVYTNEWIYLRCNFKEI